MDDEIPYYGSLVSNKEMKDVEALFSNRGFLKGDREKYRDRWAYTLLFYENLIDLDSMYL
ncbi:hypothetical protein [Lutispora thermophila]|uniref:hypothetical protein n=1 Tax=Lutispora thermophila TaxID=288966 RepID=UPI001114A132|nr:hypothetical protein [Lutispora thermophila]